MEPRPILPRRRQQRFEFSVIELIDNSKQKRLCVFCGSSMGSNGVYHDAAHQLGRMIVENGWHLVYGGSNVGLMGIVANAVLAAGGSALGVMPDFMRVKEIDHKGLTQLEYTDSMHTRKARMVEISSAFVALPGGFGTLEEFCEVVTWAQLGLHSKPCILLNINDFYNPLIDLISNAVDHGFMKTSNREVIRVCNDVQSIFTELDNWQPRDIEDKWILAKEEE